MLVLSLGSVETPYYKYQATEAHTKGYYRILLKFKALGYFPTCAFLCPVIRITKHKNKQKKVILNVIQNFSFIIEHVATTLAVHHDILLVYKWLRNLHIV